MYECFKNHFTFYFYIPHFDLPPIPIDGSPIPKINPSIPLICYHILELPVLGYPRNMVIYHYPVIGVIFIVNLYVFIIKITLISSQIITLNTHFGSFTPFYAFMIIYIQIHFPWTLPDCTRGNGNVLIFLESYFW